MGMGMAWRGMARHGMAWLGWHGVAWLAWHGMTRHGMAQRCGSYTMPHELPLWPCKLPLPHPPAPLATPLAPPPRPAPAGARSVGTGVLLTSLSLACAGFSRGGFSVNHMDVAPKFAGVVM